MLTALGRDKRLSAPARARKLARTGMYGDYRPIEMVVGTFLDAETRLQVNRLCAVAQERPIRHAAA